MDNGQFYEIYLYSVNERGTFFMYLYPFAKGIVDAVKLVHLYSDTNGYKVNYIISNDVTQRIDIHDDVIFNSTIRGYILELKFYYDENKYKNIADKAKLSGDNLSH